VVPELRQRVLSCRHRHLWLLLARDRCLEISDLVAHEIWRYAFPGWYRSRLCWWERAVLTSPLPSSS